MAMLLKIYIYLTNRRRRVHGDIQNRLKMEHFNRKR